MKEFAQRVLTERGQFPPEPAHTGKLSDLYADKSKLVRDFGVRWKYDNRDASHRLVFSVDRATIMGKIRSTPSGIATSRSSRASVRADTQIADFLAGSFNDERTPNIGSETIEAIDRMPDDYAAQQPVIVKLLNAYQQNSVNGNRG